MRNLLFIFGTRPEAIKMIPLIKEFKNYPDEFSTKICVTAQHRDMLDQVLDFFDISADYDLDLMKPNQNLYNLTASIFNSLPKVFNKFNPDYVFVHGDTTTTMAGSIAGFYSGAKVCHIEAGLRTYNKFSPFPEEINRQITSVASDYHFAPTNKSKLNLVRENICESKILVTGNTVIDALFDGLSILKSYQAKSFRNIKSKFSENDNIVLVTAHRRENHGVGFEKICMALKKIANKKPDVKIIFPVHLNPNVKEPVERNLSGIKNIILINPLSYPEFIYLMSISTLILTDSGGIQEEAPSLGKPVLVMRDTTERPEAVISGTVILVGTDTTKIYNETISLLENKDKYKRMSLLHNPYGDGKASKRIVEFIKNCKHD